MQAVIKRIARLSGHGGGVYGLAEGQEEHLIFSSGSDMMAAQWDLRELAPAKLTANFPAIVYALCHVKERGLLLAGTYAGSIHVLDLKEKKEIKVLKHHNGPVFDIQYSLEHDSFFAAGGDGQLSVCSIEYLSLKAIKKLCEEKVRNIAFNKDHSLTAVASGDGMVRIYNTASLEEIKAFKAHDLSANAAAWHPRQDILLTGGRDAHLNAWDIKNDYALLQSIPAHNYAIYSIAFSPDEKLFATASRDKTIKLWNADDLEFLVRINKEKNEGHTHSVNRLLWCRYNDYLISASDDRSVMVWEVGH
jgi:WD40 repeat protein